MYLLTYYNEPTDDSKNDVIKTRELIKAIENGEINQTEFRKYYSHAIPTSEVLGKIRNFIKEEKTLEICAGYGLWSYLLNKNIISTDLYPSKNNFIKIHKLGAKEAIKKFNHCSILMVIWPPCDDTVFDSLCLFKGEKFIYIGEEREGCTGNDKMFDRLNEDWFMIERITIPNILNHRDYVFLYQRK